VEVLIKAVDEQDCHVERLILEKPPQGGLGLKDLLNSVAPFAQSWVAVSGCGRVGQRRIAVSVKLRHTVYKVDCSQ